MKALLVASLVAVAVGTGCGVGVADQVMVGEGAVVSAPEDSATVADSLTAAVATGSILETTTGLNLRSGPGMNYAVRMVLPSGSRVTAISGQPSGPWYNVKSGGTSGWCHGGYLKLVSSPSTAGGTPTTPPASSPPASSGTERDQAVARAQSGVGFSYWWGHGRWVPGGLSNATAGSCSGSCPSCSHSGGNGADCSGYVAKIWQVPGYNTDLTQDAHPYSTSSFVAGSSQWSNVSRTAVEKADALVYNQNGAGHIFLYESGDGWGSMWAYEAKGCVYGIVHDLRTASSAYQAIRRAGY